MSETTGQSIKNCHNGACDGCDCQSSDEHAEPTREQISLLQSSDEHAEPTREQISLLQRTTGMHLSRSGRPYCNSLRCAAASGQYDQALELCEMGLMARVGDTNSSARDGVAELASFRVTDAGALVLGVNSARELTRDAE